MCSPGREDSGEEAKGVQVNNRKSTKYARVDLRKNEASEKHYRAEREEGKNLRPQGILSSK